MFVNSLLERLEKRKVQAKMFADDLAIAAEDANEVQLSNYVREGTSLKKSTNCVSVNTVERERQGAIISCTVNILRAWQSERLQNNLRRKNL